MKDYSSSISALDKAIEFCQKLLIDEPHYFSALSYYRLGEKQKSITRFEEVIKLYPNGNRRLKQMVAEQALDIQALKAVTPKNW